jgi:hypothetical protein
MDVHGVAETAPTKCSFPFRRNTSISPTMLSCFSCCEVRDHHGWGHVHSTRKATETQDTGRNDSTTTAATTAATTTYHTLPPASLHLFLIHGLGYPFIRGCEVYSLQQESRQQQQQQPPSANASATIHCTFKMRTSRTVFCLIFSSLSLSLIFLIATIWPVSLWRAFSTTPYVLQGTKAAGQQDVTKHTRACPTNA